MIKENYLYEAKSKFDNYIHEIILVEKIDNDRLEGRAIQLLNESDRYIGEEWGLEIKQIELRFTLIELGPLEDYPEYLL